MDDNSQFISEVRAGIADADTLSIFFPFLRRALVVDARHDLDTAPLVSVVPHVRSMEERIRSIEEMRPGLGRVRSMLGVPWLRSVRALDEEGITDCLIDRLLTAGVPRSAAERSMAGAIAQLSAVERFAFARMIRGEGFATIWERGGAGNRS